MTLTQTAHVTKISILVFIAMSILGLSSYIGYRIWYTHYLASIPPVEQKPDLKFGALPNLDLPKSQVSSANFTYSLNTTTGSLPSFDKLIKVYFIPPQQATFLAADKTQAIAQKFNVQATAQPLSDTKYLFNQDTKSLTISLDSGNLNYINNATPSANQTLASDDSLINNFTSLLTGLGVLKDHLNDKHTKVELLKIQDNLLVTADSRSQAQAANLYLWPQDIDQKPILTGDFGKSLISGEASSSAQSLDNYYSINFTYWPVDTTNFATYQLKPIQSAFDDLKGGKGIVVVAPPNPAVAITSIYLAYYESQNYQAYLQPIYVFEGQGFVAYVPAI